MRFALHLLSVLASVIGFEAAMEGCDRVEDHAREEWTGKEERASSGRARARLVVRAIDSTE